MVENRGGRINKKHTYQNKTNTSLAICAQNLKKFRWSERAPSASVYGTEYYLFNQL